MRKNNEKGIISVFVLFAMIFLLLFVITTYYLIDNKMKLENSENTQLKKIYSKEMDVIENESNSNNEIIPIYNIDELNIAGTGSYFKIQNKIYECNIGKNYMLRNNIIVDIDEDIKTGRIDFNDFKLYSSSYHIDNFSYGIYYYKDGIYWKDIFYKDFETGNQTAKDNYTNSEFSIMDKYEDLENYTYMMIWTDENNEFTNIEIMEQKNKAKYINQVKIYEKNYNALNKESGKFYILVNVGNKI